MITIKHGNIFESKMDILVNPVNCVGVMGKGLAAEFKKRYPAMWDIYRDKYKKGELHPGQTVRVIDNNSQIDPGRRIILFPTKDDWREPSRMEYIEAGLDDIIEYQNNCDMNPDRPKIFRKFCDQSIAFPALGCGLGGLDWPEVVSLIVRKMAYMPFDVEIYEPEVE